MSAIVNGRVQPRLNLDKNLGGRPVHPAITALDAHVEGIVASTDDAVAFDHAARHIEAMQRLCARLVDDMRTRALRLTEVVLPELRAGYEAAESLYGSVAACGD